MIVCNRTEEALMLKNLLKKLTDFSGDPKQMRRRQHTLMGCVGVVEAAGSLYAMMNRPLDTINAPTPEDKKEADRLETPFEAVNPMDIWDNRVQKEAEDAKLEAKAMQEKKKPR